MNNKNLEFSKDILKYALQKEISLDELESDYKNLLTNIFIWKNNWKNEVMFQSEILDCYYAHRTDLFYGKSVAAFELILLAELYSPEQAALLSILNTDSPQNNVAATVSSLSVKSSKIEALSAIIQSVRKLGDERLDDLLEKTIAKRGDPGFWFATDFLRNLLREIGIEDNVLLDHILDNPLETPCFADAFDEYIDEEYGD